MAPLNRFGERKRQVMLAAASRWQARTDSRTSDKATVAALGPGAADSPMRQARFSAREAVLAQAAGLRSQGQLPVFIERKIGPTLDFLSAAPSEAARKAGRPVARIVSSVDPHVQAEGFASGFLISPRLLMTNWHVFPDIGSAVETGANFLHDRDEHGIELGITFEIDPNAFYLNDETLDFAIVALRPKAVTGEALEDLGYIGLTEATSKILKGQPVDIIEYPDGGEKEYATQNNRLVDILDEGYLHYETDTLEGSSGSPAFSESWELVALHHAAIPEMRDGHIMTVTGDVWTEGMRDDLIHWVANEGVRISAIVQALSKSKMADPVQAKMLADLLATTTDPVDDISKLLATGVAVPESHADSGRATSLSLDGGGTPARETNMAGANLNFSGPVTIHVYASTASGVAQATAPSVAVAVEKTLRFDPNYDDREGYNEDFLGGGLKVPMPGVAPARSAEMYKKDGHIVMLPYHHYSLAMNQARRLQMWSAVNVDYDPNLRKQSGRAFFGTDRWIGDPRIPANLQIADPDFYQPAGQIDRGHIVRREDNAWGASPQETEYANSDTFHWTNCTPQHAAFNRETPGQPYGHIKGLWGAFEAYVQKSLQHGDTKACILAGPVLAANDPTADFGTGPVQYPITFWKVVAVAVQEPAGRSSLRTYGFVLSQKDVVDQFGIEFAPGQYARYQKSLTDIATRAGVTFDPVLIAADTKVAPVPGS
jgi:endonuclease G